MKLKCTSLPPDWVFPDGRPETANAASTQKGVGSRATADHSNTEHVDDGERPRKNAKPSKTHKPAEISRASGTPDAASEKLVTLRRLMDVADEPLDWVCNGVIPRGALTLITGEPRVGKSVFALGVVAAVTQGLPGPNDPNRASDMPFLNELCDPEKPLAAAGADVAAATNDGTSLVNANETKNEIVVNNVPMGQIQSNDQNGPIQASEDPHRASDTPIRNPLGDANKPPAAVLCCSAVALADTVRPRLIAAGAEMSQVYILCGVDDSKTTAHKADGCDSSDLEKSHVEGLDQAELDTSEDPFTEILSSEPSPWSFQLERDLPILEAELARLHAEGICVRIVVIDPIDSCFETHRKRFQVDASVAKLVATATRLDVAIVAITNSPPSAMVGSGRQRLSNGMQSLLAASRAVWVIVRDLDIENRRLLLPVKTNFSLGRLVLAYCIQDGKMEWESGSVVIKDEDYLREVAVQKRNPLAREHQFEKDRAADWLYERLSGGEVHSRVVEEDARLNEICEITLKRAFKSLGCISEKEKGAGKRGKWNWRLPGAGFFYRANAPRLPVQGDQGYQGDHHGHLFEMPEK